MSTDTYAPSYAWLIVKGDLHTVRPAILTRGLDILETRAIDADTTGVIVHYNASRRAITALLNGWFVESRDRSQDVGDLLWWRPSDILGDELSN